MYYYFKSAILLSLFALIVTSTGCKKLGFGAKENGSALRTAPVCFEGLKKENINLLKKDDGSMAIHLKWAPVESDASATFEIYGDSKFSNLLGTTDQTEWELKNPELGKDYVFAVKALTKSCSDTNNQYPIFSAPLERPEFAGLTKAAGVSNTKVWLDWNPSSNPKIKKYNIYFSKDLKNPIGETAEVGFTVEGLARSSNYCFIVKAQDIWGIEDANNFKKCADTITETVPEFAGLRSVEQMEGKSGLTKLKLNWAKAAGQVTGYRIFRSTSSKNQNFEPVQQTEVIGVDKVTTVIDGLNSNTKYFFVVRAFYTSTSGTVSELNFIEKSNSTLESVKPSVPPSITKVEPAAGPFAGGNTVTITGANFRQRISVLIAGRPCQGAPTVKLDGKSLDCVVPSSLAPASLSLKVVLTIINKDEDDNDDGQANAEYTYTTILKPVIANVVPPAGSVDGGKLITINGLNFLNGAKVFLDGSECTGAKTKGVASGIYFPQLECMTVSHSVGKVPVKVINPDSQSDSRDNAYEYKGPPVFRTAQPILPAIGPLEGNIDVRIYGTNFDLGATVRIDGKECANPIKLTELVGTDVWDYIKCTLPERILKVSANVDVIVKNEDEQTTLPASGGGIFRYQGRPEITSIEKNIGKLAGGVRVVISGSGFAAGSIDTEVRFGSSTDLCTTVVVESSSRIVCFTPASTMEKTVQVLVRNPDLQITSLGVPYEYKNPPVLTRTWVRFGPTAGGGTPVQFHGSGFVNGKNFTNGMLFVNSGTSITIDGSLCSAPIFYGPTQIDCIIPPGVEKVNGSRIVITNPDGQIWNEATPVYTYKNGVGVPGISNISPKAGNTAGGYTLTISGSGFYDPTVQIDGKECLLPPWNPTSSSTTSLVCTVPASTGTGLKDVVIFNGASGSNYTYSAGPLSGSLVKFNYSDALPPIVTLKSVAVPSGTVTSGTVFGNSAYNIKGLNFSTSPPVKVYVNGGLINCSSVSSSSLTCNLPPAANQAVSSTVPIIVENSDGKQASYTYSYNFLQDPTITSVTPNFGRVEGGKVLIITGTNFVAGTISVRIGNDSDCIVNPASVTATSLSCTTQVCNSDSCKSGHTDSTPLDVKVTNPSGQFAIKPQAFTYRSAPKVLQTFPTFGSRLVSTQIKVMGYNFTDDMTVEVNGNPCPQSGGTSIMDNQFVCDAPTNGTNGPVSIRVVNSDNQTDTLSKAFTYSDNGFSPTQVSHVLGAPHPVAYAAEGAKDANAKMGDMSHFVFIDGFIYFFDNTYFALKRWSLWYGVETVSPFPRRPNGGGCGTGNQNNTYFVKAGGMATDGVSLYISQPGEPNYCSTIVSFNTQTGLTEVIAGQVGSPQKVDGGKSVSKLNRPGAITIMNNKLYFVEKDLREIREIDLASPNKEVRTLYSLPINVAVPLNSGPDYSIHLVNNGSVIYVVDTINRKLKTFAPGDINLTDLYDIKRDLRSLDDANHRTISSVSYLQNALYFSVNFYGSKIFKLDLATGMQSILYGTEAPPDAVTEGVNGSLGDINSILAFNFPVGSGSSENYNGIIVGQAVGNPVIRKIIWGANGNPSNQVYTLTGDITASGNARTDGSGQSARFIYQNAMTSDGENIYSSDGGYRWNGEPKVQVRKTNANTSTISSSTLPFLNQYLEGDTRGAADVIVSDKNYLYISQWNAIHRQSIATGDQEVFAGKLSFGSPTFNEAKLEVHRRDAKIGSITSMALDGSYLYFNDVANNLIRRIDLRTGLVSVFAGKGGKGIINGGDLSTSQVCNVRGLVIVKDHLYFSELRTDTNGCKNAIRRAHLVSGITEQVKTYPPPPQNQGDYIYDYNYKVMATDGTNIYMVSSAYSNWNYLHKMDMSSSSKTVTQIIAQDPLSWNYTDETNGPLATARVRDLKYLGFLGGKLYLGTDYNIRVLE